MRALTAVVAILRPPTTPGSAGNIARVVASSGARSSAARSRGTRGISLGLSHGTGTFTAGSFHALRRLSIAIVGAAPFRRVATAATASGGTKTAEAALLEAVIEFLKKQPNQESDTSLIENALRQRKTELGLHTVKWRDFLRRYPDVVNYQMSSPATITLIAAGTSSAASLPSSLSGVLHPKRSGAPIALSDAERLLNAVVQHLQGRDGAQLGVSVDELTTKVLQKMFPASGGPLLNGKAFKWTRFVSTYSEMLTWDGASSPRRLRLAARPTVPDAAPLAVPSPPSGAGSSSNTLTPPAVVATPPALVTHPALDEPRYSREPKRQALIELALECRKDWRLSRFPGGREVSRWPTWGPKIPLDDSQPFYIVGLDCEMVRSDSGEDILARVSAVAVKVSGGDGDDLVDAGGVVSEEGFTQIADFLVRPPPGRTVKNYVTHITGIRAGDLTAACDGGNIADGADRPSVAVKKRTLVDEIPALPLRELVDGIIDADEVEARIFHILRDWQGVLVGQDLRHDLAVCGLSFWDYLIVDTALLTISRGSGWAAQARSVLLLTAASEGAETEKPKVSGWLPTLTSRNSLLYPSQRTAHSTLGLVKMVRDHFPHDPRAAAFRPPGQPHDSVQDAAWALRLVLKVAADWSRGVITKPVPDRRTTLAESLPQPVAGGQWHRDAPRGEAQTLLAEALEATDLLEARGRNDRRFWWQHPGNGGRRSRGCRPRWDREDAHGRAGWRCGASGRGRGQAHHHPPRGAQPPLASTFHCPPASIAVTVGEDLGYLPGGVDSKMEPFLFPIMDELRKIWTPPDVEALVAGGFIEIVPLGYMRGRTLEECWLVADEMQNSTPEQLKTLLTRIGRGCTVVVTGDPDQVDTRGRSGLVDFLERFGSATDEKDLTAEGAGGVAVKEQSATTDAPDDEDHELLGMAEEDELAEAEQDDEEEEQAAKKPRWWRQTSMRRLNYITTVALGAEAVQRHPAVREVLWLYGGPSSSAGAAGGGVGEAK